MCSFLRSRQFGHHSWGSVDLGEGVSGPESKKSRKKSPGAGPQKSEKSLEKGPKSQKKVWKWVFGDFSDLFRDFFRTFGAPGRETFSRLFWDFWLLLPGPRNLNTTPYEIPSVEEGSFLVMARGLRSPKTVVMCFSQWCWEREKVAAILGLGDVSERERERKRNRERDMYVYICCRVKHWSKVCLFCVKKLVHFCLFLKISFSLQKEEDFSKKEEIKNDQFLVLKTGPILLRNILGQVFKTRQQAETYKQNNTFNQEANKTKRKSKNHRQKWKTGRKEERKEQERERDKETEKGKRGRPKKAKEKQWETQINKQKWPFLGAKTGFFYLRQRKERKNNQKIKGGFRAKWALGHLTWALNPPKNKNKKTRSVYGQVRWPFGPPHLTLKPSPKKQKNKTKNKQKKQKHRNRNNIQPRNKQKTNKNKNKNKANKQKKTTPKRKTNTRNTKNT